jgi:ribosomal protein L37AE/L43A
MGWETHDEDTRRAIEEAFERDVAKGGKKCPACGSHMLADEEKKEFRCSVCEERRDASCSHPSTTRKYDPDEHGGLGAVDVCDVCGEVIGGSSGTHEEGVLDGLGGLADSILKRLL